MPCSVFELEFQGLRVPEVARHLWNGWLDLALTSLGSVHGPIQEELSGTALKGGRSEMS